MQGNRDGNGEKGEERERLRGGRKREMGGRRNDGEKGRDKERGRKSRRRNTEIKDEEQNRKEEEA